MVDLLSLNLALDIVIKVLFLGVLVFVVLVLKNINQTVKSASRSAESVKDTVEKAGEVFTVNYLYNSVKKGLSKKRKESKGEKDDE